MRNDEENVSQVSMISHAVIMDPWPVFTFHTDAILEIINLMSSILSEYIVSNFTRSLFSQ